MFNESTYPFNFMTTGDGVDSDLVIPDSFAQCLSYEQQIAFILKLIEDIDSGVVIPEITADATVDQSTGTPSVSVVKTGTDEAPVFTFNFHNIKGETGQRGEKGETGEQGETGRPGNDGADGVSPTVTTAQIANGYRITITDADGSHVFDIYNGNDGEIGPAGYSPTVTVQTITGGHSVTITDEDGDHTFNVLDGLNGIDGDDGISPEVTITSITGGHRITIVDVNGSHTFDVMDGEDGQPVVPVISAQATVGSGTGTPSVNVTKSGTDEAPTYTFAFDNLKGAAGQNGISPTITVTDHTTYHHIEITSAGGTESFDVYDGVDGTDGTDGVSPTVTVRSITGGHQIEIVSAGGTERFDVMDGTDGTDGISPTVSTTAITDGTRVTITDAVGSHTFDVMNGSDGSTGPAGPGVAAGGTFNQMLVKNSATDYDTKWVRNPMNPMAELIIKDRTTYQPLFKLTFYEYPNSSNGKLVNIKPCGLVLEQESLNTFNMNVVQGNFGTTVGINMGGSGLLPVLKQCAILSPYVVSDSTTIRYEFRLFYSNTKREGQDYLSGIDALVQNYIGYNFLTITEEYQESSLFMLAKANSVTIDDWVYYYYTTSLLLGKITSFSYNDINRNLSTAFTLSKTTLTVGVNDILIPVEGYNVYLG